MLQVNAQITFDDLLNAVRQLSVPEVFFNRPRFRFHEKGHVRDEDMYTAFGRSSSGR